MPGKHILTLLLPVVVGSFFLSGPATAATKMVIIPVIDVGAGYESNYDLSDRDERAVYSVYFKPGVKFGLTTAKSSLSLDYTLEAYKYEEQDDPPPGELDISSYDYVGHDMTLNAETRPTDRLTLGLGNNYILTRDPDELDPYSNEIIRLKYTKNAFNPTVTYTFGEKISLGTGYTFTTIDYSDDTFGEDSEENKGAVNLTYSLTRLNSLDLDFQYWEYDYKKDTPDYTASQIMLYFIRELKYYTISAGGGWQNRDVNDSGSDTDGFVWKIQLKGDRPKMNFTLSQNYNNTGYNSAYYMATRFDASYTHTFLKRISATLNGYYQHSDYETSSREDDTCSLDLTVDYEINRLFTLGMDLGYAIRDSNVADNDYDNAYIGLYIRFTPQIGAK